MRKIRKSQNIRIKKSKLILAVTFLFLYSVLQVAKNHYHIKTTTELKNVQHMNKVTEIRTLELDNRIADLTTFTVIERRSKQELGMILPKQAADTLFIPEYNDKINYWTSFIIGQRLFR